MKLKFKDDDKIESSSYGEETPGIDEIYLKKPNSPERLLFTNNLALEGCWISNKTLYGIFIIYKNILSVGDEIIVKSYKIRARDGKFHTDQSPDCIWNLSIIEDNNV